jgi:hypothetical protein
VLHHDGIMGLPPPFALPLSYSHVVTVVFGPPSPIVIPSFVALSPTSSIHAEQCCSSPQSQRHGDLVTISFRPEVARNRWVRGVRPASYETIVLDRAPSRHRTHGRPSPPSSGSPPLDHGQGLTPRELIAHLVSRPSIFASNVFRSVTCSGASRPTTTS